MPEWSDPYKQRLIPLPEAAVQLGIKESALRNMVNRGQIDHVHTTALGRAHKYIRQGDIDAYKLAQSTLTRQEVLKQIVVVEYEPMSRMLEIAIKAAQLRYARANHLLHAFSQIESQRGDGTLLVIGDMPKQDRNLLKLHDKHLFIVWHSSDNEIADTIEYLWSCVFERLASSPKW